MHNLLRNNLQNTLPLRSDDNSDGSTWNLKQILLRCWKILVPCLVISAGLGFLVAKQFATQSWTYETTLLYSKPAATASYTPPDGDSLAKVFKSPESLARLCEAFEWKFTPGAMNSLLSMDPPYGTCVLHASLTWNDPVQAPEILAKSIELFRQQVVRQRNSALQTASDGLRARLEQCNEQLKRKQESTGMASETHDVAEQYAERTSARGRLYELDRQLMAAHIEHESAELRIRHVANPGYGQLTQLIAAATTETQKKIKELERLTAESRREYEQLIETQRQASHDRHDVVALVQERQRLEDQLAVIHHLCTDPTAGLSIVQSATESLKSPTSNERKLALGFSIMFGLALCAPVFGIELLRRREAPGAVWARHLGLDVLSRGRAVNNDSGKTVEPALDYQATRLLALRLQQSIPDSGATLVFCGVASPTAESLVWNIARCMSDGGKRILLLRTTSVVQSVRREPATARLSSPTQSRRVQPSSAIENGQRSAVIEEPSPESLFDDAINGRLHDLISSTKLSGVDELRLGDEGDSNEGWMPPAVDDLLSAMRDHYEIVLVSGLTTEQPSDVHALTDHSSGIVFTVPAGETIGASATALVRELMQVQVPILGVIM